MEPHCIVWKHKYMYFVTYLYTNVTLKDRQGVSEGCAGFGTSIITMMDVILYYSYAERVYFSLFNDLYNTSDRPTFKGILSFKKKKINSDISVTIYVTEMTLSVYVFKGPSKEM